MCWWRIKKLIYGEPIPKEWQKVDYTFILEKLLEVFPFAKIYLSDRYYYTCPKLDIATFLVDDKTDQQKYQTEVFDCDDFSFRLMGQFHTKPYSSLAFGIAWSRSHAYNIVVVTSEGVFLIEPQSDVVFKPNSDSTYKTELIII